MFQLLPHYKQNRIVIFRLLVVGERESKRVAGENACRLRLRLPNQVLTLCVFKMASMEELVNYLSQTVVELRGKEIDVLSGTPPTSLLDKVVIWGWSDEQMNATLDELHLNGTVLIVRIV